MAASFNLITTSSGSSSNPAASHKTPVAHSMSKSDESCDVMTQSVISNKRMMITRHLPTNVFDLESLNPSEVGVNVTTDLGDGSDVVYMPRFLTYEKSWEYFHYLDKHIPWTRPTLRVFGKPCLQPRDICYIASKGLKELTYSGYKPEAYSWDDFPPLKELLEEVHKAFPGSHFNSLLINRYKSGNDYVGWHADNEKLYGPNPEIASISLGCERDFFLKKRSNEKSHEMMISYPVSARAGTGEVESQHSSKGTKRNNNNKRVEQYCFKLKHGSLLLMRGNTQRDWLHSVPKRAKAVSARVNLTFRRVM